MSTQTTGISHSADAAKLRPARLPAPRDGEPALTAPAPAHPASGSASGSAPASASQGGFRDACQGGPEPWPGTGAGPARRRPRFGHISFLNCLPLYWGLAKTGSLIDLDVTRASPEVLSAALAQGRLDVSAISLLEFLRHADDLVVLPDIAVGSLGDVRSCLILSRLPLEELDGAPVALGSASRTSVRLARLLLAERVGVRPVYHTTPPDLTAMLREHQAAVLIGDVALHAALHQAPALGLHVHDLSGMWREWTGLPFVFAVFAARKEFAAREPRLLHRVHQDLLEARDLSLQEIDLICEQTAEWETFDRDTLRDYYVHALDFSFGPRHLAAVTEFARLTGGPGAGFPADVRVDVLGTAPDPAAGPARDLR